MLFGCVNDVIQNCTNRDKQEILGFNSLGTQPTLCGETADTLVLETSG